MGCCFSKELNPNLVSERTSLLHAAIPNGCAKKDNGERVWSIADLGEEKPFQNGNVNVALDASCDGSSTNLSAIKEGGSSVQDGTAIWDAPDADPPVHESMVQKGNSDIDNGQLKKMETLDSAKQRIAETAIMRAKWFCEGHPSHFEDLTDGKSENAALEENQSCDLKDQHLGVSVNAKEEQINMSWEVHGERSKHVSAPNQVTSLVNKCSGSPVKLYESAEGNSELVITSRGFKKEQSFYSICLIDLEDLGSESGHQSVTEADAVRYASAPAVSEKASFDNSLPPEDHRISDSGCLCETTAMQQTVKDPLESRVIECSTSLPVHVPLLNEENALPDPLEIFPSQENIKPGNVSSPCKDTENTCAIENTCKEHGHEEESQVACVSCTVEDAIDQRSQDLLEQNGQVSILKPSPDTTWSQGDFGDLLENQQDPCGSSGYSGTDVQHASECEGRPPQQDLKGPSDDIVECEFELESEKEQSLSKSVDSGESVCMNIEETQINVVLDNDSHSSLNQADGSVDAVVMESDHSALKNSQIEEVNNRPVNLLNVSSASDVIDETEESAPTDSSQNVEHFKQLCTSHLVTDNLESPDWFKTEVEPKQMSTLLNTCQSSILQTEGQTESDILKLGEAWKESNNPSHADKMCVGPHLAYNDEDDKLGLSTDVYTCSVVPSAQTEVVSESCDFPNGEQDVEPNVNFASTELCASDMRVDALVDTLNFAVTTENNTEDHQNTGFSSIVDIFTNTLPTADLSQSIATHVEQCNNICNNENPVALSYLIQVGTELPPAHEWQVMDGEIGETCLQHVAGDCFCEDEQKRLNEVCLCADDGITDAEISELEGIVPSLDDVVPYSDCIKSVCFADVQTLSDGPCQSEELSAFDCSLKNQSACQDAASEQPANDTQRSSVTCSQEHGDLRDTCAISETGGAGVDCDIPLVSTAEPSLETGEALSCAIQGHEGNYTSVESSPHIGQLLPCDSSVCRAFDFNPCDLKDIVGGSYGADFVHKPIPLPVEPDQVDVFATTPSYEIHLLNNVQYTVPAQTEKTGEVVCVDELEGEQGMLSMVTDLLGKSELSDDVDCLPAWAEGPHALFPDNQSCALVSAWDRAVCDTNITLQQDCESDPLDSEDFQTSMAFIAPYPYNLLRDDGSCVWDWQNAYSELVSRLAAGLFGLVCCGHFQAIVRCSQSIFALD